VTRGWSETALGEALRWRAPDIEVSASQSYNFAGVYSHGGGVFRKHSVPGSSFAYERLTQLRMNEFVYPKLMAWEGALGVVPQNCDGCFVSPEFQVFDVDSVKLLPRFLEFYMRRPRVWSELGRLSPGTNLRRRRLDASEFLKYRISIPPMAEQQRLVAHLDAIEARLTHAHKLREELNWEIEAFTTSLHLAMADGRVVRLSQLLQLDEEQVEVSADGSYPQIGIRSFGLGLFTKPAVSGSDTTYRAFNVLRPGMFVMSQVKGWEGALGVADGDLNGWFASPEYRTFTCIKGECDSRYLSHLVGTPWFRKQLASATRGVGARRERVRPEMLLGLEIPFPECARQTRAARMLGKLKARKALSLQAATRKTALMPSLLDRIFQS
jgi:type I restriction enzyme S subunit